MQCTHEKSTNGWIPLLGDAMVGSRWQVARQENGLPLALSSAILAAILLCSVSVALAGHVSVVPMETEAQKAGTILTVSSRFLATNHSEQPVMGVTVHAANGAPVLIGDIPPHGEVMSAPIIFALDLADFDGRNLAFPVTVEFYEGEVLQSVPASFFCEIPQ